MARINNVTVQGLHIKRSVVSVFRFAGGENQAIERQQVTLKSITAEIEQMRIEVEAKKLVAKEEIAKIQAWKPDLDKKLEKATNEVHRVREWLDDQKKQADILAQEEKLQFEEKLLKTNWNCKQSFKCHRFRVMAPSWTGHDFWDKTFHLFKLQRHLVLHMLHFELGGKRAQHQGKSWYRALVQNYFIVFDNEFLQTEEQQA